MAMHLTKAPHQGARDPLNVAPNAALLIDFDNVTMGMRSDLSKELKTLLNSDIIKGKVTVQRAYADWRRYPQYIVPLSEASIDLIFAPAYGSNKKNATDIRMAIDGIELVFIRPEIGTFILLTGDSDFSSLVLKLKEYGKYVIGVGIQESSSDILVQNCDEYYSYTSLSGLRKTTDSDRQAIDPWVLVERAVEQMTQRDDVMRSDRLKQVMVELDPGFDEGEYGFSKFSRFVTEASSKGLLTTRKLENGQYEVGPGKRAARKAEEDRAEEPRPRSEERGRSGRERGDERRPRGRDGDSSGPARGSERVAEPREHEVAAPPSGGVPEVPLQVAYDLLRRSLERLKADGRDSVRDSDVKRKMLELDGAFDETNLGFSKFSRFLRQAHDHEVVDLHKRESGNYEVSLPAGRGGERSAPRETSSAPRVDTASIPSAPVPAQPRSTFASPPPPEPKESVLAALSRRFSLGHLLGTPPKKPTESPPESPSVNTAPPPFAREEPALERPTLNRFDAERPAFRQESLHAVRDDAPVDQVEPGNAERPPRRPRRSEGEPGAERPRRPRGGRGRREPAREQSDVAPSGDAAQPSEDGSADAAPRPRRSRGGQGRGRRGGQGSSDSPREQAEESPQSPPQFDFGQPAQPGPGVTQADGFPAPAPAVAAQFEPRPLVERPVEREAARQIERLDEPAERWTPPVQPQVTGRGEEAAAPADAPSDGLDGLEPSRLHGRTKRGRRR